MRHTISMTKILEAINYYQNLGYALVDVPLCVDRTISEMTKPSGVPDKCHTGDDVYVASAEQSFIQMWEDGSIDRGWWMALTPCYRHEGVLDDTHYSVFLKLELIVIGHRCSNIVLRSAEKFFSRYTEVVSTPTSEAEDSWDIVTAGEWKPRELGSYGVRYMRDGTPYTYGTGVAEPRLSSILESI